MKKVRYDWNEFDSDIEKLAKELKPYQPFIKNIYGIPRGGVIPAICLAHKLEVPVLFDKEKINEHTLIVDDIADRGDTMSEFIMDNPDYYRTATLWISEATGYEPSFYIKTKKVDEWIVMPWEKATEPAKKNGTK